LIARLYRTLHFPPTPSYQMFQMLMAISSELGMTDLVNFNLMA